MHEATLCYVVFDSYLGDDELVTQYTIAADEKDNSLFYVKVTRGVQTAVFAAPDCVCISNDGFSASDIFEFESFIREKCKLMVETLGEQVSGVRWDPPFFTCYVFEILPIFAILLPFVIVLVNSGSLGEAGAGFVIGVSAVSLLLCLMELMLHLLYRAFPSVFFTNVRSVVPFIPNLRTYLWGAWLPDRRPAERIETVARYVMLLLSCL